MIFASRNARGPDPHLRRKVQIFAAGAALGLVGIGLDSSLLVGLAILVLAVGMVLRLLPGNDPPGRTGPESGQGSGGRSEADGSPDSDGIPDSGTKDAPERSDLPPRA